MGLRCFRAEHPEVSNLVDLSELIQKNSSVGDIARYMKSHHLTRETFFNLYIHNSTNGWTPLPYPVNVAATSGRVDLLRLLFKYGYKTNEPLITWLTPTLHKACTAGKLDVVRSLVEDFGENVNEPDVSDSGNVPLILAARSGHLEVVKYLVNRGTSVDICNEKKETALHSIAKLQQDAVCEYLISQGADIQARDNTGSTPLHSAAEFGSETTLVLLLDAGADIDSRNDYNETAFYLAIKYKHACVVSALSERGADPEAVIHKDMTPLDSCILQNMYTVACHLVLDLNVPMDAGHRDYKATPMAVAIMCGHPAFCNLFLLSGYTPVKDDDIYSEKLKPAYRNRSSLLQSIRTVLSNPPSLQALCAFRIRRVLGRRLPRTWENLPLPLKMRDVVKLEHVRSKSYQFMSAYPAGN